MSERNLSSVCEIEICKSKFISCGCQRLFWILAAMSNMNKCSIYYHKKILLHESSISEKLSSLCEIEICKSKFISCDCRRPSWILADMLDMNECLI